MISVAKRERKLVLSVKAHEMAEEKQAMADFGSSDSGASLGDILGAALNKAREEGAEEATADSGVIVTEEVSPGEPSISDASEIVEETAEDDREKR